MTTVRSPALFSFAKYRKELEGGYLFNPYLMAEIPLEDAECGVVELCDGRTPTAVMAVEIARRFRTDRQSAEDLVTRTLTRLSQHFVLNWSAADVSLESQTSAHPVPRAQDECVVPSPPSGCLISPLSILWEITHACNLSCMHCLSACGQPAESELSTAEALDLIDQMADMRVFWFTLGGGEPLMRPDVFSIMEHATDRDLCVRLTTNGYAVTERTLQRLDALNVFSVQVSIDGLPETHDRIRGQRGAYERAIRTVRLFREAGCSTLGTVSVNSLNVTEIPELIRDLAATGIDSVKIGPCVPLGRAATNQQTLALSRSQIRQLAVDMQSLQNELNGAMSMQLDGLFPFLLEPAPRGIARGEQPCGPGCSAGVSQLVVSYDGSVYPCPYIRDHPAGNTRDRALADIWCDEPYFGPIRALDPDKLEGKCAECGYRPHVCRGGCRGAAYAAHGSLYAEDPNCWRETSFEI